MKNNKVKIFLITFSTLIILIITIFLFRNVSFGVLSTDTDSHDYWDGTTVSASLSGSGTQANPYLIENGEDFAKFIDISNNSTTKYYYRLTDDIYLNKGYFHYNYSKNVTCYYYNGETYFIRDSINYYTLPSQIFPDETPVGHVNKVTTITNFKSVLDGNNHSVIGLFIPHNNDADTSFINVMNSSGSKITNINFLNSVIVGSQNVGFINTMNAGTIENVVFNGSIYNYSTNYIYNEINGSVSYTNNTISLNIASETELQRYHHLEIKGTTDNPFTYNGTTYNTGSFTIRLDSSESSITITPTSGTVTLSNLTYKGYQRKAVNCGFISIYNATDNLTLNKISIHGSISGFSKTGGLIGNIKKSTSSLIDTEITNCYNNAVVYSENFAGGIIGYIDERRSIYLSSLYNNGNIQGRVSGGIIGYLYWRSYYTLQLNNIFNSSDEFDSDGQIIGKLKKTSAYTLTKSISNVFFIHSGKLGLGNNNTSENNYTDMSEMTYKSKSELLTTTQLNLMSFNSTNGYVVTNGKIPCLTNDDVEAPNISVYMSSDNTISWNNNNYNDPIDKLFLTEEDYLTYQYSDDSEIGSISNLFFDEEEKESTMTNSDLPNFDTYLQNIGGETDFFIAENSIKLLVVRVIDIYGNVGIARSDSIIYDPYSFEVTNGVDHNTTSLSALTGRAVSSRLQMNYRVNHTLTTYSFPYDNSAKLYLETTKLLTDATLYLYDYLTDNTYYLPSNISPTTYDNKYYYDLSSFVSIYNSNVTFNSTLASHYSNNQINEDFEINIYYPSFIKENGNPYRIYTNDIVVIDNNSNIYKTEGEQQHLIASSEKINAYNLTATANGTLNFTKSNSVNINYNISNNIMNIVAGSPLYDELKTCNKKIMKIELTDSTNTSTINNFVPFDIKYLDSSTGNTYNANSNSVTYIPIESNSGTLTTTIFGSINPLDIESGLKCLRLTVYNRCNSSIMGTTTIPITFSNAQPRSNNSFEVSIDEGDKIVDKDTGTTNSNDRNLTIHSNYTGTLTSPKLYINILKIADNNNSYSTTNISPDSIFLNGSSSYNAFDGTYYYYTLSDSITSGTPLTSQLIFKNNLPEGKYIVSICLFNSDKKVTSEKFNMIIK